MEENGIQKPAIAQSIRYYYRYLIVSCHIQEHLHIGQQCEIMFLGQGDSEMYHNYCIQASWYMFPLYAWGAFIETGTSVKGKRNTGSPNCLPMKQHHTGHPEPYHESSSPTYITGPYIEREAGLAPVPQTV